jgi:hypothetical protein
MAAPLVPYRQGGLDTMCGLYAVVNATRLVIEPRRRMKRAACVALFAELIDELATCDSLVPALSEGCDAKLIARMLRRAKRWLRTNRGVKLRIERPYARRKRRARRKLVPLLTTHLSQLGRAAIIGTTDHWTVARDIAADKVLLFDSNGRTFMWVHRARASKLAERLHLPDTFLLSSR